MSDSTVSIAGNLTADPELRYTPSGAAVANFTVAVNRRRRTEGGQWEDELEGFFRCNAWKTLAENVAESLHKGDRILATGRLHQRSWQTGDGAKRYEVEIEVDDIGPSLKWAVASIQRRGGGHGGGASQDQRGDRGQGPPPADHWGASSAQPTLTPQGAPPEGGF